MSDLGFLSLDCGEEEEAWLIDQLGQWPRRVHRERTTSIEFLMKSAAARLRAAQEREEQA